MVPVKEAAIRLIESLPEDCSLEDIQYHLYVRQKVERGIAAIDAAPLMSQEETERKIGQELFPQRSAFVNDGSPIRPHHD
jgi:hypothetical protein